MAKPCVGGERVNLSVIMWVNYLFHSHISLFMEMVV